LSCQLKINKVVYNYN